MFNPVKPGRLRRLLCSPEQKGNTMTDREKITQVFYDYEDGGLVSADLDKVMRCLDKDLIGIGIGEQGFVTSLEDVRQVFLSGVKNAPGIKHSLSFEHIHILIHEEGFANLCAKVIVRAQKGDELTTSQFLQFLTLIRRGEEWKICGLHASSPVVTEESVEAYPLKFAEKTLQSLKEKIGEEAYLAEEQYRQAVLADTIAFYIINFSLDLFEKCQLNGELCAFVEPGTPYEQFLSDHLPLYVLEEDRKIFLETLSLQNVMDAFASGKKELNCEYRFLCPDGSVLWMVTIVRLITDVATGDKKGIMYVKDIDAAKHRELDMIAKADRDVMTGVLNKSAFIGSVSSLLCDREAHAFVMLDIDNFKAINDTNGHPAGDQVLIAIAGILKDTFSADGIVGRLGGDEFAAFIQGFRSQDDLRNRLEHVLEQITKIKPSGKALSVVTCSIGVALSSDTLTIGQLYKRADDALYRAKQNGKNQIAFYICR